MASARLARFVTEVAPPQFVTVMRHRTSKMLDTIKEDEREASSSTNTDSLSFFSKGASSSLSTASVSSPSNNKAGSNKYFGKDIQRFSFIQQQTTLSKNSHDTLH